MKKLLCVAIALLMTLMFVLPAAAIINVDGSEPEWTGAPGIRPADDVLELDEPFDAVYDEEDNDEDEPDVTEAPVFETTTNAPELDDSNMVDVDDALLGAEVAEVAAACPFDQAQFVVTYVALGISVLALVLAIIALAKNRRSKDATGNYKKYF